MKKIGILRFGLTFAGCFLGAGYVSGQELWQFFGSFGRGGLLGLAAAVGLLYTVAVLLLRLAQETGLREADKLVVCWDVKALRLLMSALELTFLFGVSTIMTAGAGALLQQLFGVPSWLGSALFAAVAAGIALAGLGGLVSAFSVSVPILVVVSIGFGIFALIQNGFAVLPAETCRGDNPMMPVWFVGALTFANYNIFGNIAILSPFAGLVRDKKTVFGGLAFGAVLLLAIAFGVLAALYSYPESLSAELPMLAVARGRSEIFGYVYGVLLLLAMFGTALSSEVAFADFLCRKSEKISNNRRGLIAAYMVFSFAGSLAGFGDLIGAVYPVFGYCSSVFVVLLVVHYFKNRAKKHHDAIS